MSIWFYILRLCSGTLYPGATKNLGGKACRTPKIDPPVALVYTETFESLSDARKRELQVKRWSRAKKEALVSGNMAKLKELGKSRKRYK